MQCVKDACVTAEGWVTADCCVQTCAVDTDCTVFATLEDNDDYVSDCDDYDATKVLFHEGYCTFSLTTQHRMEGAMLGCVDAKYSGRCWGAKRVSRQAQDEFCGPGMQCVHDSCDGHACCLPACTTREDCVAHSDDWLAFTEESDFVCGRNGRCSGDAWYSDILHCLLVMDRNHRPLSSLGKWVEMGSLCSDGSSNHNLLRLFLYMALSCLS